MFDSNFYINGENVLFTITIILIIISMLAFFIYSIAKKNSFGKFASGIVKIALIVHTIAIIFRGIGAQRLPLSNQYEFATAFAWGIILFYVIFEKIKKDRSLGAYVTPIAFLLIGYAAMQNKEVRPLMPALQSGWLGIHVSMAILSYGAFAIACGLSAKYLFSKDNASGTTLTHDQLDDASYKLVMIGYILLTLTIITGALWAQKAWNRYWAWDPKETWSLITWFIYTAYLHMRRVKNLQGRKAAWFLVIGFICVIFTYIGVNTLIPSLHSYK